MFDKANKSVLRYRSRNRKHTDISEPSLTLLIWKFNPEDFDKVLETSRGSRKKLVESSLEL